MTENDRPTRHFLRGLGVIGKRAPHALAQGVGVVAIKFPRAIGRTITGRGTEDDALGAVVGGLAAGAGLTAAGIIVSPVTVPWELIGPAIAMFPGIPAAIGVGAAARRVTAVGREAPHHQRPQRQIHD